MLHPDRHFQLKKEDSPQELARLLTTQRWGLCQGFQNGMYLYLNDALEEDLRHEYVIIKDLGNGNGRQLTSINFGWAQVETAEQIIRLVANGVYDCLSQYYSPLLLNLETDN
tara:strand:+ start:403 stop:738 length:336 start_codon:yes stop_codon:yes gene_type:complete